jgi:hypothetical protein
VTYTAINLLRTKLQASGSTGHPQTYDGFYDVLQKTMAKEGWRGMYRGLTVTLAKVVPAVSISYVVRLALPPLSILADLLLNLRASAHLLLLPYPL